MKIALITARGGSKGLKRKNILPLLEKPLIAWTIEAALSSEHIDDCYVTTEDDEIKRIAIEFGAKIIDRPFELAADDTTSEDVISHSIKEFVKQGVDADIVVLLQPTSPLRGSLDIDKAIDVFDGTECQCVISVYEPKHSPAKAYKENPDGSIVGLLSDSSPYRARQSLPRAFQPNGAIYVFSKQSFEEFNQIPRVGVKPYLMSEEESIDIDTIEDFELAESLLRKRYEA